MAPMWSMLLSKVTLRPLRIMLTPDIMRAPIFPNRVRLGSALEFDRVRLGLALEFERAHNNA